MIESLRRERVSGLPKYTPAQPTTWAQSARDVLKALPGYADTELDDALVNLIGNPTAAKIFDALVGQLQSAGAEGVLADIATHSQGEQLAYLDQWRCRGDVLESLAQHALRTGFAPPAEAVETEPAALPAAVVE